jgi:RNA polymerase sigma-70 factor (ECF subfamily)
MNDPDIELVRLAKQGSKADFGKLVNQYYEMVYAVVFGVVHNREAARDVAQEVFMKAWRDIGKFAEQSKFKTWLYRVAVNAGIDHIRQRRPADSLDSTDTSGEEDRPALVIPDKKPGPRELGTQAELRQLLDRAIEQLSPEHRAVIVMREWQELSYEEIADILGVQIGTVMSRLFYARKKLAEILGQGIKEKI